MTQSPPLPCAPYACLPKATLYKDMTSVTHSSLHLDLVHPLARREAFWNGIDSDIAALVVASLDPSTWNDAVGSLLQAVFPDTSATVVIVVGSFTSLQLEADLLRADRSQTVGPVNLHSASRVPSMYQIEQVSCESMLLLSAARADTQTIAAEFLSQIDRAPFLSNRNERGAVINLSKLCGPVLSLTPQGLSAALYGDTKDLERLLAEARIEVDKTRRGENA